MPLNQKQKQDVCSRKLCFIDFLGNIYNKKDANNWVKLGRIYYKEKSNLYHITTISDKNLEGQESFEKALDILMISV